MQLLCDIQLSRHPELANARFRIIAGHCRYGEVFYLVHRSDLVFDGDTFVRQAAWGISPERFVFGGSAHIRCEEVEGIVDNGTVLVRFPTAEPSDALPILLVPTIDVEFDVDEDFLAATEQEGWY